MCPTTRPSISTTLFVVELSLLSRAHRRSKVVRSSGSGDVNAAIRIASRSLECSNRTPRSRSSMSRRTSCPEPSPTTVDASGRGEGAVPVTIDDSRRPALLGGERMNDKPKWQVARLDDIERRGRDIPVREHLGIQAFGINAYTPGEDGTLIGEHDEAGSGQEELYIVLDGKATFEIDGERVDAPPGTLVFVRPESRRKATGDGTVLAVGATPGEAYQAIDWGDAWPFHRESLTAYGEQ